MIYPTVPITVVRLVSTNVYGEPVHQVVGKERCAPVRLRFSNASTTVRTDSAGTRGHAQEDVAEVRVLVVPRTKIQIEDCFVIAGKTVRVTGKEPRMTVGGKLDHYELTCDQKVAE